MATRAQTEAVLVKRLSSMLEIAGLDNTTVDGTNEDLNDPIAWAVFKSGGTVADPTEVTTEEVAAIAAVYQLFDLAELRTMETILGNYSEVDSTVGPRSEKFDQLAKRLLELIPAKRKQIENEYGVDLGELKRAGVTAWRASDGLVYNRLSIY